MRFLIVLIVATTLSALLAFQIGVRRERGRWERIERAREVYREARPGVRLRRVTLRR